MEKELKKKIATMLSPPLGRSERRLETFQWKHSKYILSSFQSFQIILNALQTFQFAKIVQQLEMSFWKRKAQLLRPKVFLCVPCGPQKLFHSTKSCSSSITHFFSSNAHWRLSTAFRVLFGDLKSLRLTQKPPILKATTGSNLKMPIQQGPMRFFFVKIDSNFLFRKW